MGNPLFFHVVNGHEKTVDFPFFAVYQSDLLCIRLFIRDNKLTLKSVNDHVSGTYTCTVSGTAGSMTSTIKLGVQSKLLKGRSVFII